MSATSGGGGSVSEGSEAGGSSQSTMSVNDSPSTSFQTNFAENVTKITLSEENSPGDYGAEVTGSKINLSLDERQQQKDGIVNVAFEYEEGTNRGGSAGDFKLINGSEKKEKVPEAVNLELVNMVPYSNGNGTSYGVPVNGIPMKKDSEQVDMSTPYDEYFVPVNEHKKYMRGEKLYVTKDKRRPTSWRRCLSWIVACTVISVVLIVAILAGTGVILSQEPNLVKEASVGRNFAGSNLKPSVTNKSPLPTPEMYMYVPRSIESEFVIDNLDFDPALKDQNSTAYQQFAATMEDHLKMLLFDKETLEFGASDVGLKVINISRDPFKVNYRIGWNYKQGVNNPPEPIKMEDVKKRLVESLARNQDFIDKYHIDREAIKVNHVINTCQMDNGGCSHICYYNYITQQFTCTCPTHLVLDNSGKNCVAWIGSSEDDAVPVPNRTVYPKMSDESTANPIENYDFGSHYQHGVHQGVHHHLENEHRDNIEPSPEPEPEPEPKPASKEQEDVKQKDDFEPTVDAVPEPSPDHENKSSLDFQMKQAEHGTHSFHEISDHGADRERTYEPDSDRNYHDHAFHSVYESKESETKATPEPEPTANFDTKDHNYGAISVHESKDNEPLPEPTLEPVPEPTAEPNSQGESTDHSEHGYKDHETVAEPEPAPEPVTEHNSKSMDHHQTDFVYGIKDNEPSAEPTPEPIPDSVPKKNFDETAHHQTDHIHIPVMKDNDSSKGSALDLTTETNLESKDQSHGAQFVYEPKNHESSAQPVPEPVPEPTPESDSDDQSHFHINNSQHETKERTHLAGVSTTEPDSEFSAESDPKSKDHNSTVKTLYGFKDHESAAEPTPEPNPASGNNDYHTHLIYESNNHDTTPEPKPDPNTQFKEESETYSFHDYKENQPSSEITSKNTESPPESIHEPNSDSAKSKGSETTETTVHPILPFEYIRSDLNSSLQDSDHHLIPSQEEVQVTQSKTDNPAILHSTPQSDSDEEKILSSQKDSEKMTQSGRTVPHLEDILIRKPNRVSENQNATGHSQNPLDNIELTPNGEPVIEEIIFDKSGRKSEDQTGTNPTHPIMSGRLGNESDPNSITNPAGVGNNINHNDTVTDENTTKWSVITEKPINSNIQSLQPEVSTDHPKIVEYSAVQYETQEKETGTETERPDLGQTGNKNNLESGAKSNFSQTSQHLSSAGNNSVSENATLKSEHPVNQGHKSINPSQDNVPVTTIHPEMEEELHTIPVTVEFLSPVDTKETSAAKPKSEQNQTEKVLSDAEGIKSEISADDSKKNPDFFNGEERPEKTEHHVKTNSTVSRIINGGGSVQTDIHEMATEPQLTTTTLLPTLKPAGKINGNMASKKGAGLKETEMRDKSHIKQSQAESNETTKSPGEISNNIKDELLDNEEFNTLIDKEYKTKESISNEGKDTLNKYPNKSLKAEKKKLKDYIKGEKTDSDKKADITVRPAVTPEDFILQKHVNGNENTFDLDYSLQNEHTTRHDGEVTLIDPHVIEKIPGVSLKPHGINNHDISVLQTVAPDFRTETVFPSGAQELETLKPEPKNKFSESKEGEPKLDKDYKFDKDYKYEKQKVSKKKDLKKKIGGKDGKNVELDDGRKYFTEVVKDDLDMSQEAKDILETTINPLLEKTTATPATIVKIMPGSTDEVATVPESHQIKSDDSEATPQSPHAINMFEVRKEVYGPGITEQPGLESRNEQADPGQLKFSLQKGDSTVEFQDREEHLNESPVDQHKRLMIDEPTVKSTSNTSPGTIYDEHLPVTFSDSGMKHMVMNSTILYEREPGRAKIPGTVFDGISQDTRTTSASGVALESNDRPQGEGRQNTTFIVYENTDSLPKMISKSSVTNSTTAHPTIIIHGQSGNLQDGHILRFANSTFHNPKNATVISIFNGTLNHPEGHSFSLTNYTATFPNGSAVHPTIVVRGQSGTLQDGHELRFGNSTFQTFVTPSAHPTDNRVFKNSNVYRIENGSLPGTVFDGHFNPRDGHYHMFTNSSGTYVYSNATSQPAFIIKGESGDFGNSTAYIVENKTSTFSGGFTFPLSVTFRNATVFAVENRGGKDGHDVTSNETIQVNHQVSPSFVSSATAYKVNNYFGYISKCAAGQFQCMNGTSKRGSACINLSSKCDSINDCSDGSDEQGCVENGCQGNFQCADGTCLKRNLVCNGILDCSDGSDEKNCESWKCEFDEFQCSSGRCIPIVWQCDGKPDCDNHTDEYNCQTSCGNDEYLCPEGWCIPLTYKCNGVKECNNGEDEHLCDCSHEEFKCQTGGCVSVKQVCDGLDDCPDRSDEWDCVKLEPSTSLLKIRSASGSYEPVCADNWSLQYADEVCASLGYFSSVPIENENSSITTETSFYVLKNDTTADFNRKILVNLRKSDGNCSSGKLVEISCQEFSCGSRSMTDSSSVEARLVGGMSATAGQWPSVALLYNIRNFHSCTANVLTPRWVLVSYNCLKMGTKNLSEQDWKFFGGSTVFEAERENAETRRILSIIPHPQVKFNQFLFTNDLALVELDQPLQFTSNLGAVCLPDQEIQPRQICVTAGWGMSTPEDKVIRQQLEYLPVPTMNLTECNSTEHYSGFITEDKICAGYNSAQKSLCYNEEGAPLMCVNDRGEWELQGILSYHSNCGRGSHPSIFSSITPVADWIKKTTGNSFEKKVLTVTKR